MIHLPTCAAVDTELQVGDELVKVWLNGWPELMNDRICLIIEMRNLLKWPLSFLAGTLKYWLMNHYLCSLKFDE